jgi:lysophospholipase L1-like esterase
MKTLPRSRKPSRLGALATLSVLAVATLATAATENTTRKFSFGPGSAPDSFTAVPAETTYSEALGYGFEPGDSIVTKVADKAPGGGFCTSDKPFYFSVALPEGNYRITVTLGDKAGESDTTIKAELRRLMLEKIKTAQGEVVARTFIVNLRTPRIGPGHDEVRLKPRETTMEAWAWDNKLTLEFNGARPCLSTLEISRADDVPTVYLTGDSTVCDQPREPWASWGQMLPRFFKPDIAVANHAESGEALRSSRSERRFAKIFSTLKRGDTVIIQFGHNDEKEKGDGIGAFASYKTDLTRLVTEVREHGGTPVLVTPMHRRTFDASGHITNSHGDYPEAVRQVAREKSVALIDLNLMSQSFYEALGPEKSAAAFSTVNGKTDATHHNGYGSYELAKCIVNGIVATKLDLASHLIDGLPVFDPTHPDPVDTFSLPESVLVSTDKPYGN